MDRGLSFWLALPVAAGIVILMAIALFAPDLLSAETGSALTISWMALALLVIVIHVILKIRACFSPRAALYAAVAILVVAVTGPVGAYYGMTSNLERNGVPFGRTSDGRFRAMIDINGSALEFFVDLDSKYVLLSPSAAKRIGIDPSTLTFDVTIEGPDGRQSAAAITLKVMAIRDTPVTDVPALVSAHELKTNVLGRDFFDRTSDWGIKGGFLMILP
ncbi:MAG TPA: TIGR02281 family clan AA aspartic protease [Dongiaceae bacterium]|nr:TIGR02281 family clan AA aspartic protease [Dongiaceae bacterium]